jgi:hypothetical protein
VAPPAALTSGFQWGFWALAGIALVSIVAAIALVRESEIAGEEAEAARVVA